MLHGGLPSPLFALPASPEPLHSTGEPGAGAEPRGSPDGAAHPPAWGLLASSSGLPADPHAQPLASPAAQHADAGTHGAALALCGVEGGIMALSVRPQSPPCVLIAGLTEAEVQQGGPQVGGF